MTLYISEARGLLDKTKKAGMIRTGNPAGVRTASADTNRDHSRFQYKAIFTLKNKSADDTKPEWAQLSCRHVLTNLTTCATQARGLDDSLAGGAQKSITRRLYHYMLGVSRGFR